MPHAIFISDLHLCPDRPEINKAFFAFLGGAAARAGALYILGDLFEYWAGDDDADDPFNASVLTALNATASGGTRVYLMHGNRDFLIGQRTTARAGASMLADPAMVDLYGTPTLLMHGDTLCTDDTGYVQFRDQVRAPDWQRAFLARSLTSRKQDIAELRRRSMEEKRGKSPAIMDVSPSAVQQAMRAARCTRLIHGHTHQPGVHDLLVDGQHAQRVVLGDWYESASFLRCDRTGCRTVSA